MRISRARPAPSMCGRMACGPFSSGIPTATGSNSTIRHSRDQQKKAAASAPAFACLPMRGEPLRHTAPLLVEFVFDLELPALERSDQQIVVSQMRLFSLDFAFQLLVTPFQCGDVAFSRHDNSPAFERPDRHKKFATCRPPCGSVENRMQIPHLSATHLTIGTSI